MPAKRFVAPPPNTPRGKQPKRKAISLLSLLAFCTEFRNFTERISKLARDPQNARGAATFASVTNGQQAECGNPQARHGNPQTRHFGIRLRCLARIPRNVFFHTKIQSKTGLRGKISAKRIPNLGFALKKNAFRGIPARFRSKSIRFERILPRRASIGAISPKGNTFRPLFATSQKRKAGNSYRKRLKSKIDRLKAKEWGTTTKYGANERQSQSANTRPSHCVERKARTLAQTAAPNAEPNSNPRFKAGPTPDSGP